MDTAAIAVGGEMSNPRDMTEAEREAQAIAELRQGDGTYYVAQERAFAPGIAGEWPAVIKHPTNHNGRLIKRIFPGATVVRAGPPTEG